MRVKPLTGAGLGTATPEEIGGERDLDKLAISARTAAREGENVHPTTAQTFRDFQSVVSARLRLDPEVLYGRKMKLAEVIARSPAATNSIDLMEAFAGAMAELGIDDRLELPTMTLQSTVDELMAEVQRQLEAGEAGAPR
jgi:hypothetical protein